MSERKPFQMDGNWAHERAAFLLDGDRQSSSERRLEDELFKRRGGAAASVNLFPTSGGARKQRRGEGNDLATAGGVALTVWSAR